MGLRNPKFEILNDPHIDWLSEILCSPVRILLPSTAVESAEEGRHDIKYPKPRMR